MKCTGLLNDSGFTLLELLAVVAVIGAVVFSAARLIPNIATFFQHGPVLQKTQYDTRICLDTIGEALGHGNAASLQISTRNTAPLVPNSQIDFVLTAPLLSGTTAYAFYLSNGSVIMQEYRNTLTPPAPKILAQHVSYLMFTGNSQDPTLVYVNLRIDAPLDAGGQNLVTQQILGQQYQMATSP